MTIIHVVLFEFKADTSAEKVTEACEGMLALRNECHHPTSSKPYIKTSSGGVDNSPEGLQGGLTHGFVVEFESAEDRDYYVKKDPAHQKFIKFVGPLVEQVKVVDYEPGKF
ncbi:hypothetical protein K491DRAFT_601522 [Lophiostoma macrostomum CBS 122681]|uniref:Stress-response A/B barrel domain-containing protein n=1 Tax=Lophiostoma macrostomum CBS 122681 TaxID=1314788 RepID=A0A6A6T5H8_9PLEO|nr:hypothetical protein K491DRAFT_601522 [Lophiostoma macrostomum CBS 122681]